MEEEYVTPPHQSIPMYGQGEQDINNIVAQIDPKTIIDNLDHALKGETFEKETGNWLPGKPLVNEVCRGTLISFLNGLLTNNTTMAMIDEKKLSSLMEGVIQSITKSFRTRLEEFGFVPPGEGFERGDFQNKGTPDTGIMTMVSTMVYIVAFMVFTRALSGSESKRIFKSLTLSDSMGFGMAQQQQKGWLRKLVGV